MLKALAAVAASSRSDGRKHAFLLMDLNNFKRVNDLQGHALGDRVLQVIARRLRSSVGPTDLLARLGGDEFALLCYDVNRDTALAIARRFSESLESEIQVGGHSHKIGASIGAALIPDDGSDAEEIIHHADLAMYRAKAKTDPRSYSLNQKRPVRSKRAGLSQDRLRGVQTSGRKASFWLHLWHPATLKRSGAL